MLNLNLVMVTVRSCRFLLTYLQKKVDRTFWPSPSNPVEGIDVEAGMMTRRARAEVKAKQ